jgi:orotate phosphoribosyltransferase
MVAIFTYGLSDAEESFKAANCSLHTLTNYNFLVSKALERNYIQDSDMQSLIQWRENPRGWGLDK